MNLVVHELQVRCKATAIPKAIAIDVGAMKVGEAVHLRDIKLPEGAKAVSHDDNATLLTIAAPSALKSKEAAAAATATAPAKKK